MRTILVTGAGAILGQGILRCLNFSDKKYNIISADPDVRATGHALAQKSYVIPFATAETELLDKIKEIIAKEKVEIIFIGTDVELPLFSKNKRDLENNYGVKIVVSDPEVILISNDKWLTAEFLRKNNFPYPQSALTSDPDGINTLKNQGNYPYIAKPVDGARSKGLRLIESEEELTEISNYKNNLVVQERIGDDEGEFTTGCLVTEGRCVAVVSLVRDLRDGNTWRAYREGNSPYDSIIARIAEKLNIEGPANFQYRIRNGEPVIFEINCRFSGTTPLRLMFGFNEVEAVINYYLEGEEINQPQLKSGTVLRTFSDLFIPNENLERFKNEKVTEDFGAEYYPFKPLGN